MIYALTYFELTESRLHGLRGEKRLLSVRFSVNAENSAWESRNQESTV